MMCKAWADQEAQDIETGKEIGKEIGAARVFVDIVANVHKNTSCSLEEALRTVGKSLEDYEKAKKVVRAEIKNV